jgi:hypothetical protein
MKIKIHLKDPDGVYESIKAGTKHRAEFDQTYQDLKKWIMFGEYVTIEFDLDKGTAEVLEAKI